MNKSNRQRRIEIKARRAERAKTVADIDPRFHAGKMPAEAVALDSSLGICGSLAAAIAPRLSEEDIEWVLDLYLNGAHDRNRFALGWLFDRFEARTLLRRFDRVDEASLDSQLRERFATLRLRAQGRTARRIGAAQEHG